LTLIDFAFERYARPGVKELLLQTQDDYGQSVCLLLWAAWARSADMTAVGRAIGIAHWWEQEVIRPLRQARRALAGDLTHDTLRETALALELDCETDCLGDLAAISSPGSTPIDEALAVAASAWGNPPPLETVVKLARLVG
jgi:uncharacterized protein (TIGR02444 family)